MSSKPDPAPSASSLERLVPDQIVGGESTGDDTLRLHLARYQWASDFLASHQAGTDGGPRLLDAACGVGYGSALLAGGVPGATVRGVDIDPQAIEYARQRYQAPNVSYELSPIEQLGESSPVDAIVSLETVEHVPDPASLIAKFQRLLRPGGYLILSVPTTPSVDVNPYHLTDFSTASIRALVGAAGFTVVDELPQTQWYSPVKILTKNETRLDDMRPGLVRYYLGHPGAACKRLYATLRFGFSNRYLTLACRRD